ncbi:MAG TPA: archaetidylserine decarboxylase [Terriglobia bacterium]|nr:archaetidylserine decarboxylase [Terriglobia bacterium]
MRAVVNRTAAVLTDIFLHEDINFLLTNRIPRRYATLLSGWFCRIRSRTLTRIFVALWSLFDDLRLYEAKASEFDSINDCFVRELRDGARRIDPDPCIVTSPCDAIVGAFGRVEADQAIQAKGFPYFLQDLLDDTGLVERHARGIFVTLRLRASMYHRFHAPCDGAIRRVRYISGDTWNVNPIALKRVERLFCKNERAVVPLELAAPNAFVTLVPVAAILVGSIRLHCVPTALTLRYTGATEVPCDAQLVKGQEVGYFESGSTIVVFASGQFEFSRNVVEGSTIRVGEALFTYPSPLSTI